MLRISRTGPPTAETISVDELKEQSAISGSFDDALIGAQVVAAREWCEGYLNRTLVKTRWVWTLDCWPSAECVDVPRSPLMNVVSVTYHTTTAADQDFPVSNLIIDTKGTPGRIALDSGAEWPAGQLRPLAGVEIVFDAGYGDDAADVPEAIRAAVKMVAADLYENREASIVGQGITVSKAPFGAIALLDLWRDTTY